MEVSGGQLPSALERAIRKDRVWLAVGLSTTIILAWLYLVRMAADMNAMVIEMQMHAAMGMTDMRSWGAADWAWTAFSAAASAGQVGLHRAALMADDMRVGPAATSGMILLWPACISGCPSRTRA